MDFRAWITQLRIDNATQNKQSPVAVEEWDNERELNMRLEKSE
jgi:hypothetical protein